MKVNSTISSNAQAPVFKGRKVPNMFKMSENLKMEIEPGRPMMKYGDMPRVNLSAKAKQLLKEAWIRDMVYAEVVGERFANLLKSFSKK